MPTHQSAVAATPEAAARIIPMIDAAMSRGGGSNGAAGLAVADLFLGRLESLANEHVGSRASQQHGISEAVQLFDHGNLNAAVEKIERYTGSGDRALRIEAHHLHGEMLLRLGRETDAINAFQSSLVHATGTGRELPLRISLAEAYRGRRQFDKAISHAKEAVKLAQKIEAAGGEGKLGDALFSLAVMEKNSGLISEASASMQRALAVRPKDAPTQIAAAGYLALEGKKALADELFAKIPVPTEGTIDHASYSMNASWYSALKGDRTAVVRHMNSTLATAAKTQVLPSAIQYFETEVDFDAYRKDPTFAQTLAAYKKAAMKL